MNRATFNHTREDGPFTPCPECAIAMYWEHLLHIGQTLAANLVTARSLCRAFDLGVQYGAERVTASWNGGGWTYPFEPGCGREP